MKDEDIVNFIDVNSEKTIVSEAGLKATATWYRKKPSRLVNLAKTTGYVSNLFMIIVLFCGPSRQQSPFNAQTVFRRRGGWTSTPLLNQLRWSLIWCLRPIWHLSYCKMPNKLFSDFVVRLGNYVPRDITYSTQRPLWTCWCALRRNTMDRKRKRRKSVLK